MFNEIKLMCNALIQSKKYETRIHKRWLYQIAFDEIHFRFRRIA